LDARGGVACHGVAALKDARIAIEMHEIRMATVKVWGPSLLARLRKAEGAAIYE
jgi:hypothetical protein